jgi:hypothetical protein
VFELVLEFSRPPSAYIRSLHGSRGVGSPVGSRRGCLTRLFPWWHRLPSWSNEVDGLASPYSSLWLIKVCWGDQTSPRGAAWSCYDDTCREEEASRGVVIGWWLSPLLVLVHEIS